MRRAAQHCAALRAIARPNRRKNCVPEVVLGERVGAAVEEELDELRVRVLDGVEDRRVALLVGPVEVDLDRVGLRDLLEEEARLVDEAVARELVKRHLALVVLEAELDDALGVRPLEPLLDLVDVAELAVLEEAHLGAHLELRRALRHPHLFWIPVLNDLRKVIPQPSFFVATPVKLLQLLKSLPAANLRVMRDLRGHKPHLPATQRREGGQPFLIFPISVPPLSPGREVQHLCHAPSDPTTFGSGHSEKLRSSQARFLHFPEQPPTVSRGGLCASPFCYPPTLLHHLPFPRTQT